MTRCPIRSTKGGSDPSGDHEALEQLRDAFKLIFSRPNSDNMIAKISPDIRRELSNYNAFEDTMSIIATEAISRVKDDSNTVTRRSTDLFVLENLLSEIRPEVAGNQDLQRVVQKIADAHIKIDDEVARDRKLRAMFQTTNPSTVAAEIMKQIQKKK
jgi:hypothetical protein